MGRRWFHIRSFFNSKHECYRAIKHVRITEFIHGMKAIDAKIVADNYTSLFVP